MSLPGVLFFLRLHAPHHVDPEVTRNRIAAILRALPIAPAVRERFATNPAAAKGIGSLFGELVMLFQRQVDAEVCRYHVFPDDQPGAFRVLVEKEDDETALHAGELVSRMIDAALADPAGPAVDAAAEFDAYIERAIPRRLDPNARLILQAARRLDIPVLDLEQNPFRSARSPDNPIRHGLLQLGLCSRQHRFLAAMPQGAAGKLPPRIREREMLMHRLRAEDLPTPRMDLEFPNTNRLNRVLRAANTIGFPVVLKRPASGEFRDAVPASDVIGPIRDTDQLAVAYEAGFQATRVAWVESYQPGPIYRFLVADSEVISVVRLDAPIVVGDGASSVRTLIEGQARIATTLQHELAWRQMLSHHLTPLRLQLQGLSMDSIAAVGTLVQLDFPGVAHTNDRPEEQLDRLADTYRGLATRAVQALGLHLAGVDIAIDDLNGPATSPNAMILGVRPEPDLYLHSKTDTGAGRLAAERLIRSCFPTRDAATVPIVAITGTNGKTTTSRMVASMFRQAGQRTGLACSDGVYVDDTLIQGGDLAGIPGSLTLYPLPEVEALVLETARGGLIALGRPFDRCDVGVCLNIAADHLGQDGVLDLDQLAVVKRQVIENSRDAAVLNADDPRCLAMAAFSSASRVVLFSGKAPQGELARHIAAGGMAVYTRPDHDGHGTLCYYDGTSEMHLIELTEIPATMSGKARHNIENAAAATAAAIAVGVPVSAICASLRRFAMSFATTPSRLNELEGRPYRIVMDAAHNLHGLKALMDYLDGSAVAGKRMILIGASSRFPESEVREMARLIAPRFDRFICKKYRLVETHTACREPWLILRDELVENGIRPERILVEPDPMDALAKSIEAIKESDLLVVLVPAGRSLESGVWEEILRLTGEPA